MTRNSLHIMKYSVLMLLAVILLLVSLPGVFCISPPEEEWRVTLGESNEDGLIGAHQTRDGGYVIGGHWSESGSTHQKACIIKLDKDGNEKRRLILDTTSNASSWVDSFVENSDGSITATAYIYNYDLGMHEYRLVKVNEDVTKILGNNYLTDNGLIRYMDTTEDGGYILTGSILDEGNDEDLRLMKVNQALSVEWDRSFPGSSEADRGNSVKETNDGYIITGVYDEQYDNEIDLGWGKLWLFKTDRNGARLWDRKYGDSDFNAGYDIKETPDGDYIIAGAKDSEGHLSDDLIWILKTDMNGNMRWERTYSKPNCHEVALSIDITDDNGYIITGYACDGIPLIRTDEAGNELWRASYTTSLPRILGGVSVEKTKDGGYIIAGNIFNSLYDTDMLLIKLEPDERKYSISGIKFNDRNGNGIRERGEEGLPGWTIELIRIDGAPKTTTTGASGEYTFQGLESGIYIVREVLIEGWRKTYPVKDYYEIKISDEDVVGIDFGNNQYLFSISGRKFNDLNRNGLNDTGEPGLSNWIILLLRDGIGLEKTSTDISGHYRFDGLKPGEYILEEDTQDGWVQTCPPEKVHRVSLKDGDISEIDFGNSKSGEPEYSVSGIKFNDRNGNGIRERGEEGLPGWTIELNRIDSDSMDPLSTATTGANGEYIFRGVKPGDYIVGEVPKDGWKQTYPKGDYHKIIVSDADVENIDFGNYQYLFSISGMKFNDLNRNGLNDTGEPGLSNWIILLSIDGSRLETTTTDISGHYRFDGLKPGEYILEEDTQDGWVQTCPPEKVHKVSLKDRDISEIDFGNSKSGEPEYSISGIKFNDRNGNGIRERGEEGLPGWTILLLHPRLDVILNNTTTDSEGYYRFDGLGSGDYILREILQEDWVQTYPPDAHRVSIKDEDISGIDFGNSKSEEPEYSISGIKFNDINGNAKNDGEPGLEGWTIILAGSDGFLMKATTDKYGEYSFKGLKKGEYSVYEVDMKGWIRTKPPLSGRYSLKVDRDITGIDFGNRRPWISGVKFADLNKNGQREDEPGLPDWEITLTPYISAGPIDPPIFLAKTDSCGRFMFTDILPGRYIVNEVLQEGWERTYPAWSKDPKEDIPLTKIDGHVIDVEFSDVTGINFGNYPQKAVEETAKV